MSIVKKTERASDIEPIQREGGPRPSHWDDDLDAADAIVDTENPVHIVVLSDRDQAQNARNRIKRRAELREGAQYEIVQRGNRVNIKRVAPPAKKATRKKARSKK